MTVARQASLQTVAEMAGTSMSTVSRVLSGKGPVRQTLARRVLQAVHQSGYVPNRAASALARGPSVPAGFVYGRVGLADVRSQGEDKHGSSFLGRAERAGCDVLERAGIDLMLCRLCPSDLEGSRVHQWLARARVDGVLAHFPRGLDPTPLARAVPTVVYGVRSTGGCAFVEADNEIGVWELVRHLAGLGHRRLLFVGTELTTARPHAYFVARRDAFVAAVAAAADSGVQGQVAEVDRSAMAAYARALGRQPADERPTALVACCDQDAVHLLYGLHAAGVRVPQEISIVGFDGKEAGEQCVPALTTWAVDWEELGAASAEQLIAAVRGQRSTRRVLIGGRLVVRGTSAPPRALIAPT